MSLGAVGTKVPGQSFDGSVANYDDDDDDVNVDLGAAAAAAALFAQVVQVLGSGTEKRQNGSF